MKDRIARLSDPATSHVAAIRHQASLSERRAQVLFLVRKFPGLTSGELSRRMYEEFSLPLRTCAETPHKRLPELEESGHVKRGRARKCKDSGYEAATWVSL